MMKKNKSLPYWNVDAHWRRRSLFTETLEMYSTKSGKEMLCLPPVPYTELTISPDIFRLTRDL